MKQHQYRITVEHLADANGNPSTYDKPLTFNAGNHDDIFRVVEFVRARGDFSEDQATAFAVGLKLFGETLLENKDHPLFADFRSHFVDFMKHLKKGRAE
ncbi:DUF3861 domain-containing protein [Thalassolituus sp. LLYu03]|uniref:DUF3861 domain-containing protein n=1 Tax=Thalassolituus sp. LLYu03 TaxID=3421656 RepID=UPI003D2C6B75